MFKKIKDSFYESLSESIKNRKEVLGLKRKEILLERTRVSKIVKNRRNEHHPHLIGKGEYHYLIYLFLKQDHDSFIEEHILEKTDDELIKNCGNNYDVMLWGHIDWDTMFRDVITELSELGISEDLGMLFEDTLVDYAPYAAIRYDKLDPEYAKIYISPDEKKEERQNAIERVHLGNGSELFKQTFLEKFSGKTLHEFDKAFPDFVSDYLKKRTPSEYSLGLQVHNFHINLSYFAAYWQNLPEVQYGDVDDKESDLQILLEEYIKNGREHMQKLVEYQQEFDKLI